MSSNPHGLETIKLQAMAASGYLGCWPKSVAQATLHARSACDAKRRCSCGCTSDGPSPLTYACVYFLQCRWHDDATEVRPIGRPATPVRRPTSGRWLPVLHSPVLAVLSVGRSTSPSLLVDSSSCCSRRVASRHDR